MLDLNTRRSDGRATQLLLVPRSKVCRASVAVALLLVIAEARVDSYSYVLMELLYPFQLTIRH